MKKNILHLALVPLVMAVSCNVTIEEPEPQDAFLPESITIAVPGTESATKVDFTVSTGQMIGTWSTNDAVAVTPGIANNSYVRLYRVTNPGSSTGTFVREGSGWIAYYMNTGVYFPGDRVASQISYLDFSYDGQVQSKSNPLAHTKNYYSFFAQVPGNSIDIFTSRKTNILAGASSFTQSSCMRILVSGRTFVNPTEIRLTINGGTFYGTNYHPSSNYAYYANQGETLKPTVTSGSLSLGLSGYGTESSIEAYLMMSDGDVTITPGGSITVSVICSDGAYSADVTVPSGVTIPGGCMHTINVDSGWYQAGADYTQYEWDGDVVTLQERNSNLDLVLMGDGFIAADFAGQNDGTYGALMREAADEFFSMQPLKSWKDQFNIYYVKVPSPERFNVVSIGTNGANVSASETKLGVRFTNGSTSMTGSDGLVVSYAQNAFKTNANTRAGNMTVIVLANVACRAGTCVQSFDPYHDFGNGYSIAYSALGHNLTERHQLVHHEASGHGFGKLADEYTANSYYPDLAGAWNYLDYCRSCGLNCNVDKYDETINASNVYWHSLFGTTNNYESTSVESLGVYNGAYAVINGFCRPSEDSIMNSNVGGFNAPSRRFMYYRYRHLTGNLNDSQKIFGTSQELSSFLSFDATILPEIVSSLHSGQNQAPARNLVEDAPLPLGKPIHVIGHWENGEFIPDERR